MYVSRLFLYLLLRQSFSQFMHEKNAFSTKQKRIKYEKVSYIPNISFKKGTKKSAIHE